MQLNSRPSPRKQRQAKDVLLAKGVVVSVLSRHGTTASETDGVCALEAVQWLCPWRGDVGQNFHSCFFLRRPKASSSTYFPWKWPRWSDFAFHCVRWWPKFSAEHTGDDSDSFLGKLDVAGLGPALQAEPWCWTQSTDLLPTPSGIGRDASSSQLLELEDLALLRRRLVRAAQVVTPL